MTTVPNSVTPALLNPAAAGVTGKQMPAEVKEAAKQFEAVFLSQMMSHMFEGIEADPMFGGGAGEDMFHSMLVDQYGKQMAAAQGIGISDQLQKMMLQMQQR